MAAKATPSEPPLLISIPLAESGSEPMARIILLSGPRLLGVLLRRITYEHRRKSADFLPGTSHRERRRTFRDRPARVPPARGDRRGIRPWPRSQAEPFGRGRIRRRAEPATISRSRIEPSIAPRVNRVHHPGGPAFPGSAGSTGPRAAGPIQRVPCGAGHRSSRPSTWTRGGNPSPRPERPRRRSPDRRLAGRPLRAGRGRTRRDGMRHGPPRAPTPRRPRPRPVNPARRRNGSRPV